MAKGRPIDPTREKRGTGHRPKPSETAIAVASSAPIACFADPPADLAPEAHDMWRVAVEELASLRTLHESDLPLVEMLVSAAYRHRQARAQIDQYGPLVKGKNGPMVNPMLRVEKDMAASYLRLAETLGLTPVARLRLGLITLAGQSILEGIDKELEIRVKV
jgi:P27 family predicted phage terminase small subunit